MFQVAIPSYNRVKTLNTKTLRFLIASGIHSDRITIFVANQAEAAIYRAGMDFDLRIVVGVLGIGNQRAYMEAFYPAGTNVLFIDDDLNCIKMPFNDLRFPELIEKCFRLASEKGCSLFGFHPNDDGRSLKDEAIVGLRYIIGVLYGLKIPAIPIEYPRPTNEDWTRSMELYKREGKVLRFNGIGINTKAYAAGGLSEYRKTGVQEAEMIATAAAYPGLCVVRRKPGKPIDLRLRVVTLERLLSPL